MSSGSTGGGGCYSGSSLPVGCKPLGTLQSIQRALVSFLNDFFGAEVTPEFLCGTGGIFGGNGSLFVLVRDADENPILNATVSLDVSIFVPITENMDGIYPLPQAFSGTRTVTVSAPGFQEGEQTVSVEELGLASAIFTLQAD